MCHGGTCTTQKHLRASEKAVFTIIWSGQAIKEPKHSNTQSLRLLPDLPNWSNYASPDRQYNPFNAGPDPLLSPCWWVNTVLQNTAQNTASSSLMTPVMASWATTKPACRGKVERLKDLVSSFGSSKRFYPYSCNFTWFSGLYIAEDMACPLNTTCSFSVKAEDRKLSSIDSTGGQ